MKTCTVAKQSAVHLTPQFQLGKEQEEIRKLRGVQERTKQKETNTKDAKFLTKDQNEECVE